MKLRLRFSTPARAHVSLLSRRSYAVTTCCIAALGFICCSPAPKTSRARAFVTTAPDLTDGTSHHAHAISTAVTMIQTFSDLSVTVSRDPNALATLDSGQFDVLVFPAVCPWQFTDQIQAGISRFVSAGKGFVGIHCAADTANFAAGGGIDPTWYRSELLGGLYWSGFPWLLSTLHLANGHHPSTVVSSINWSDSPPFEDEMYAFQPLPANKLHLLLTVNTPPILVDPVGDGYSAQGYVVPHPSSFCRQNIGAGRGRSWVTALGHVSGAPNEPGNTYALPWFPDHIHAGILWAAGVTSGDCPDDNPALAPQ